MNLHKSPWLSLFDNILFAYRTIKIPIKNHVDGRLSEQPDDTYHGK